MQQLQRWPPEIIKLAGNGCSNCSLVLREDQRQGQLIGKYAIECRAVSAAAKDFSACAMSFIANVIEGTKAYSPAECRRRRAARGNPRQHQHALRSGGAAPNAARHRSLRTQQENTLKVFDWGGAVESCV